MCLASTEKLTIAITGATGLVGSKLVSKLTSLGHTVRVLTRNVNGARSKLPYPRVEFYGPSQWEEAVCGTDGVANLAGEPISTRWTTSVKQEIKRSRAEGTRNLVDAINGCEESERPEVLVSSSAVGYYGTSQSEIFKENSNAGEDYLADVCKVWEQEAGKAAVDRLVIFRTGIVLAKEGGAIGKMLPIFNLFAGGPLGSGQQWCSWIHRDDLVNMFVEALTNKSFKGTYNATAPNPVRMSDLCASLGSVLGRPSWLPVPDFAIQVLLGEGAGVVLEGQKVLPARAEAEGYKFRYPDVDSAVKNILR